jgi:hypothetical protein
LKEEIENYNKRTDYMTDATVVGARVGFVRALIGEIRANKKYQPPEIATVQVLVDAANNTDYPIELRTAISNMLANVSDLQGQVRGMRIEQARSKELSDANA